MSFIIRQSTQITAMLGPFLDATDGVTEETGLAGGGTEISKNGGAYATGPTLGTHDAEGWYPITLTTTHTNTVGRLRVKSHNSGTHLPVWLDLQVIEETVYDAMFAASAAGELAVALSTQGKADVNAEADTALADYDPPTRAELTSDIGGLDTKIDTIDGIVDAILIDTGTTLDAKINTIDSIVDAIVVDTGTTIPDTLAVIAGYLDTEIAAILADTDELQTNQGNWLTATGFSTHSAADVWTAVTRTLTASTNFNDLSEAQVKAQAEAALVTYHLDHLLAVDYDPASKPGVATALFNELIESNSGVSRYTAAALAQAPSGSGLSLSDSISDGQTANTVGKALENAIDFLDAAISGVGGAVGSGADAVTLTILEDDGSTPIADADVWVSTDSAGSTVVAGTLQTNSLGKATFQLDAGVTYYRWVQKDGLNFTNPTSFVAVAD